jgi:hypothetical protein
MWKIDLINRIATHESGLIARSDTESEWYIVERGNEEQKAESLLEEVALHYQDAFAREYINFLSNKGISVEDIVNVVQKHISCSKRNVWEGYDITVSGIESYLSYGEPFFPMGLIGLIRTAVNFQCK